MDSWENFSFTAANEPSDDDEEDNGPQHQHQHRRYEASETAFPTYGRALGDDDDDIDNQSIAGHPKSRQEMASAAAAKSHRDQSYVSATLAAVGSNFVGISSFDETKTKSLFMFRFDSPTRQLCRDINKSTVFNTFVLLVILGSCIAMAMEEPLPEGDSSSINDALNSAEIVFTILFTIEATIKIVALGFISCGPNSYLRDGWNVLDFFIVVISLVTLILGSIIGDGIGGIRALRGFRILRPLRLISTIESLQIVLNSLLRAIPKLFNVFLLFAFFLVMFAILGLQFYRTTSSQMCFDVSTDDWGVVSYTVVEDSACSITEGSGRQCPDEQVCLRSTDEYHREPPRNYGMNSFANAGTSVMTVFVATTLEGWTDVMYTTTDTNGAINYNWIYFLAMIVLGAFLITNLVLGVLSGQFTKEGEKLHNQRTYAKSKESAQDKYELSNYQDWLYYADQFPPPSHPDRTRVELPNGLRRFNRELWNDLKTEANFDGEDPGPAKEAGIDSDKYDVELPMLLIKKPDGERIPVGVSPGDTIATIKSRVRFDLPSWATHAIQPDGSLVGDNTPVEKLKVILRSTNELNAMLYLDNNNRKTLLKSSSIAMQSRLAVIARSKRFNHFILFMVFANTCVLAADHYPEDKEYEDIKLYAEIVAQVLFTLEAAFKIFALGWTEYTSSKFNRLDLTVVIVGLFEFTLVLAADMSPIGFSIWRCLRLIRLFRYTSYWEGMSDLASALLDSVSAILSLVGLLVIFMFIFALVGMQFFGGKFNFDDGWGDEANPRSNFNSFLTAFFTMFQVLTGEDWNSIMGLGIKSEGGIQDNGWFAVLFFFLFVLFGSYVLLNIFLAIAVSSLDDAKEMKFLRDEFHAKWDAERPVIKGVTDVPPPKSEHMHITLRKEIESLDGDEDWSTPALSHWSCFPANFKLRRTLGDIAFDKHHFEPLILILILASSATLIFEDYVDDEAEINQDLIVVDYFFTLAFIIEMVMKMIALGVVFHPGSYLRDAWNVLDCIVVLGSTANIALHLAGVEGVSAIKILRTLRVLRPLRTVKRLPGLKNVMMCMVTSAKKIGNILVIMFLFIFIFAAIGVQLFKGAFASCSDATIRLENECIGNFVSYQDIDTVIVEEREWSNPDMNFDNIFNGMVTLFAVSTTEGWVDVLNAAKDSTEPGMGPRLQTDRYEIDVFFVVYMLIITFFMINIFVGYVVTTYVEEDNRHYADSGLNKNQRNCLSYIINVKPFRQFQNSYRFQDKWVRFVEHRHFNNFITVAIIGNTILLMMEADEISHVAEIRDSYSNGLEIANYVFSTLFLMEAMFKVIAYNPTVYLDDGWNRLDFLIVVSSIADVAITLSAGSGVNVTFLRLFRVVRVIKLVAKGEDIRRLLFTFIMSFKQLPSVGLLIGLVFFIYAIVGMQFFAKVPLEDESGIDRNNNFQTFPMAMLLLFRCSTGENWQLMMMTCSNSDVSFADAAIPYFITFNILCGFMIVNLFVAVICDNFEYLTEDDSTLGRHHMDEFIETWAKYDPAGTGYIPHNTLPDLMRDMQPPLGFGKNCPTRTMSKNFVQMNAPVLKNGTVHFNAILLSITRMRLDMFNDFDNGWENENASLKSTLRTWYPMADVFLLDKLLPDRDENNVTLGLLHATFLLQALYRQKLETNIGRLRAGTTPTSYRAPRLVKKVPKIEESNA